LFEFFSCFFYFSLFSKLVTCVRCQCTHKGEIEDRSVWGPVASGVKCGSHGGKKSKTKSWTGAGAD
jgi:hypothetical protein